MSRIECSLDSLCNNCRLKKKFCFKYHLVKRSRWYKFFSNKFIGRPQWLIEDITTYSSFDIKFFLREIFKEAYQLLCDDGHASWKLHLLKQSLVCKDYKNYWEELVYKHFVHKCSKLNT